MSSSFWYSDPSVLFAPDTWYKFVPTADMPVADALNSVVRFSIYLSILLFLSSMRPMYLGFIPVVMLASIFLNAVFPQAARIVTEPFRMGTAVSSYVGTAKSRPTEDNPFMNPTLTDIHVNWNAPPADDVTKIDVRDEVNKAFTKTSNIYMDTTNVFQAVQAQRNFYTVPTDDHAGLLKFLAGNGIRGDKLLSEGYVAAKGTVAELPADQTITLPTSAGGLPPV